MNLNTEELISVLGTTDFYSSLKIPSELATKYKLGRFLRDSSEIKEIAQDALGTSIETLLLKVLEGGFSTKDSEKAFKNERDIEGYLLRSVNNYLIDRAKRWGSHINTNAPAARSRVQVPLDIADSEFFDTIIQGVHTRTSVSRFEEGALDKLIDKANLTEDEKWIIKIRSSDIKLSKCVGRESSLRMDRNLMLSTCQDLEELKPSSKRKAIPNCTCRFIEMPFSEIEKKYGGKADTYQRRFKKGVDKLRQVAEEL